MNKNIDELLVRIHALQDELEDEYRRAREEWAERKLELAEELQRQQRRYKTGLFHFLRHSRLPVALTAPVIYARSGGAHRTVLVPDHACPPHPRGA